MKKILLFFIFSVIPVSAFAENIIRDRTEYINYIVDAKGEETADTVRYENGMVYTLWSRFQGTTKVVKITFANGTVYYNYCRDSDGNESCETIVWPNGTKAFNCKRNSFNNFVSVERIEYPWKHN